MNISKFVERRDAVKEQLGLDKLLTSCIFAVESRVHACAPVQVLVKVHARSGN